VLVVHCDGGTQRQSFLGATERGWLCKGSRAEGALPVPLMTGVTLCRAESAGWADWGMVWWEDSGKFWCNIC
jgi:hypothetical protein